eukprot:GEMP01086920.1.p1 GENE.GEMP01086920.1~~GEMP01086920.1.p1  ORF type:complete len:189 (-),score=35.44 GEMP01086920.1:410-976(-)
MVPVCVVVGCGDAIGAAIATAFAKEGFSVEDTSAKKYYKVWEMAAFAAFLTAREAIPYLRRSKLDRRSIIFTNATAALRGAPNFSAFSGACMAKRALAMSLCGEVGPEGIHVAHLVIDGPVDSAFVRHLLKQQGGTGTQTCNRMLVAPSSVSETAWFLHSQPPDCWTFEMDVRPKSESAWWSGSHSNL